MSSPLSGWRDWCVAVLATLDCFINVGLWIQSSSAPAFIFGYLLYLAFLYVVPFLLFVHYVVDGFRWQLYPLYLQLLVTSFACRYNFTNVTRDNTHSVIPGVLYGTSTIHPSLSSTLGVLPTSSTLMATNLVVSCALSYQRFSANVVLHQSKKRFGVLSVVPFDIKIAYWLQVLSGVLLFHDQAVTKSVRFCFSGTPTNFMQWLKMGVPYAFRLISVVRVVMLFFSVAMCFLFPIPSLPEPSGAWGCGVEEIQFVASSELLPGYSQTHQDILDSFRIRGASRPPRNLMRRFQCLIFYPIEHHRHKHDSRYPWLPSGEEMTKVMANLLGLPSFFFRYLLRLETNSIMLAPLSKRRRKYPIVFLSHGIGFPKTGQSMLCEGLASQGSIVVAIEHTDGTAIPTLCRSLSPSQVSSSSVDFVGSISAVKGPVLPRFDEPRRRRDLRPTTSHHRTEMRVAPRPISTSLVSVSSYSNEAGKQVEDDAQALSELMVTMANDKLPVTIQSPPPSPSSTVAPSLHSSQLSQELEFRHSQLMIRVAELRAAHQAMIRLSETSGSWIKDRIDWNASSVIGFGFGSASALLTCICDHVDAASRSVGNSDLFNSPQSQFPTPPFQSCVLLCPWLDAVKEFEMRFSESFLTSTKVPYVPKQLPQNFLLINTPEQLNEKMNNQIRLIKLIKEAAGDKLVVQFSRCKNLDFTDIPVLAPLVFRRLGRSGPRCPSKTAQMMNRVIFNFLNHHYRQSLFAVGVGNRRHPSGWRKTRRRARVNPSGSIDTAMVQLTSAGGSESETAPLNTFKNFPLGVKASRLPHHIRSIELFQHNAEQPKASKDPCGSATPKDASPPSLLSKIMEPVRDTSRETSSLRDTLRTHFRPSTLHALKLAGVPDHYTRNLSGLRSRPTARDVDKPTSLAETPTSQVAQDAQPYHAYDIMEGVAQFVDEEDVRRQKKRMTFGNLSGGCFESIVAEVCHI